MAHPDNRDPVLTGLAPVYADTARVLILGSMPGARSLEAQRYYAHPRNAFWPIMGRLCGFSPTLAYARRLERLRENRVALWDVIGRCRRRGSLDQKVEPASIVANDFERLFRACPRIELVAFNGRLAEQSFGRHVWPGLSASLAGIERARLPSTSPAHAAMNFEQKFGAWQAALNPILRAAAEE
ncbi:MAG: DNA-deoxyinosine glycosylase [Wenzhouxiangellaceae bacterium]|nr:DNA-deoxyinosine glycosylase [Wenzhouxiangellaceae bacterium]